MCITFTWKIQKKIVLTENLGLEPDQKFGPRAMGFEWPDPARARFWVSPNKKNCTFS